MPTLNLSSEQAETLAQVLEDYISDLRMEVANTDSQEFRDDLKKKELFLKDLLSRLGGTATSGAVGAPVFRRRTRRTVTHRPPRRSPSLP